MITCFFENGNSAHLRHVTVESIAYNQNREICLVKRGSASPTEPNKYAIPGGFLDRDENIAQGTLRELKEETGYDGIIKSLFIIFDRPGQRNSNFQNVGFVYLLEIVDTKTSTTDGEVSEVIWISLDNLPSQDEMAFNHLQYLTEYKKYLTQNYPLPLMLS